MTRALYSAGIYAVGCTLLLLVFGCSGSGDKQVCGITDNGDGTRTITCNDGTSATLSDGKDGQDGEPGKDGTSCTLSTSDGVKTISCNDGSSFSVHDGKDGQDGEPGEDGTSCSVSDNGDGTKTITCTDGTSVVVRDGTDGQDGEPGEEGEEGKPGEEGTSCSVSDNGDGSKTISCTDGTFVTVRDGADGEGGTSCSVIDNDNGTKTLSCTDGTFVDISDGNAESCTVTDHQDGTATLSCPDGTSFTFNISVDDGDILEGSFIINNHIDIATINKYREVEGDVVIAVDGLDDIMLPNLQRIGRNLKIVGTTLLHVNLPALERVELDVQITSKLSQLGLPALQFVGGAFNMSGTALGVLLLEQLHTLGTLNIGANNQLNFISLPSLDKCSNINVRDIPFAMGISFPLLTTLHDLDITDTGLTSFQHDSLTTAAQIVVHGAELVSFSMPALQTLSGILNLHGEKLESINLNSLTTAHSMFIVGKMMASLAMPALQLLTGDLDLGTNFASVELDALHTITGDLRINSMQMTTFSLSGLRSAGEIEILGYCTDDNDQTWLTVGRLEVVSLPELAGTLNKLKIDGAGECTTSSSLSRGPGLKSIHLPKVSRISNIYVGYNSGLELLDLPTISPVTQSVFIHHNPSLPQCLIEDLENRVGWTQPGGSGANRDNCTCAGHPLMATCCDPDHLGCCGNDVCWIDTCGHSGEIVESCPLVCLDGQCVGCEDIGMVNCSGQCKLLGTHTDCSGCGDNCGSKKCENNQCVRAMVPVPGNSFMQGCNTAVEPDCSVFSTPIHQVYVQPFLIDKYEVTAAQYLSCVDDEGCTPPTTGDACNWGNPEKAEHPINCVTWHQASSYCSWAGKRLCTESEWELAARGTDGRVYPWGNEEPTCDYAVMNNGVRGCGTDSTWPVGSKPLGVSPYGALDMTGNVLEWVEDDWHTSYTGAPNDGSAWVNSPRSNLRILRGGGFYQSPSALKTWKRGSGGVNEQFDAGGIRCCKPDTN
ncbi:MAG: SUMF1/EgtB/PvdO family nonheme iron enzyme [Myxococcota bacterium]|jgi:sulfatase modifying factor 1